MPYRTIDLCAGIGGIRRGFELNGNFVNVLSAETDRFACATYEQLYHENPYNDLTSDEFKNLVDQIDYDILLAGFPCQTFSRAGLQEGFENQQKGIIFFHISEIIRRTRPKAIFLENVDHLFTHDNGRTFQRIIDVLEDDLNYKVIGVERDETGQKKYDASSFTRNSKNFGVPQNRPRVYIIGFDRMRYDERALNLLGNVLPESCEHPLYVNLHDVLELNAEPKYYLSSGYLDTLIKHRERQKRNGNGFGYRVVNTADIENPIANTLLATGGSGKERNLVFDPQEGIGGIILPPKKTPLNNFGIRVMTPREWGKLQGFINYAFVENGIDNFQFPEEVSDLQKYKQFGNSVTIPVIQEMAAFINRCLQVLEHV